jgi:hypothetical protein
MNPECSLPCSQDTDNAAVLSQLNPAHTPHPIYLRSILISSSHLLVDLPSGLFSYQNLVYKFLFSLLHAAYPASFIHLDFIVLIIWRVVQIVKLLSMQSALLWGTKFHSHTKVHEKLFSVF